VKHSELIYSVKSKHLNNRFTIKTYYSYFYIGSHSIILDVIHKPL